MMNQLTSTQPLTVKETDKAIQASLPSSVISKVTERVDKEYNLQGYRIGGLTKDEIDVAIQVINKYCEPLPPRDLDELLGVLYVKTKQAKQDQSDLKAAIQIYARGLSEYPADIVREVLTKWGDNNIWWPSWSELKADIAWRNKRGMMRNALVARAATMALAEYGY